MSALDEFAVCRDILESLLTGVCVIDMHKKILFWSDGAERITGHLRHEIIGRSCVTGPFLHCHQNGCEYCAQECPLVLAIKTSHPIEATGFLLHKSGYEIPVRVRAVPVRNQHGFIIGAVETFDDLEQGSATGHAEKTLPGCIDELTGLASRARMQAQLRQSHRAFTDQQVPLAILRLRLPGLEHFRAAFGNDAASSLLKVSAQTLASGLSRTDVVGRWADDEFLVILNSCGSDALHSVGERLHHMLANDSVQWWGERRSLPICLGEATALEGDSVESLLSRAQQSLEAASACLARAAAAGENPTSGS